MKLTVDEALLLQDDLLAAYGTEEVQKKMYELAEMVRQGRESQALQEKSDFLLEVQKPIVSKHGFEASAQGVHEAMMAFSVDTVNLDPAVYKRNNRLELLLSGGLGLDSYYTSWQMVMLRNLGIYREIPEKSFPIVGLHDPKRMDEGRIGKVLRQGILDDEETEQLVAACKRGDSTKASQLLGVRKIGASTKAILVNVGYKKLGPAGAEVISKALSSGLESLELDISGNQIGPAGAKALASKLPSSLKILKLNLSSNGIGLEGVKAVAAALPKGLEVLSLGFAGMKMGEAGARALAEGMPPNLVEYSLDLYGNNVGDEGVCCISRALPASLEYLNVMLLNNNLSRRGLNVLDRQIGDPLNQYHLPKLTNDNFKKTADLEVYEFKEMEDGSVVRQLDFRSNF